VLVLIRDEPRTVDIDRLGNVAESAALAHVEVTLHTARQPMIVGAAALVGIDSFTLPEPRPERVRLNRTRIGEGDRVTGTGRLDARADGPIAARPVAVADGPAAVARGNSFLLSAERSEASHGRRIARHIWTWD
jgi:hypothetical protein